MKQNYNVRQNITLVSRLNNEHVLCDIINEEEIEGKKFFVVRTKNRIAKLSKEAFSIKNTVVKKQ